MMTMPETVSPFRSVAPLRGAAPTVISAMSRSRNRCSFVSQDHDATDIVRRGGSAATLQRVLLRGILDIAAAKIRVVVLNAFGNIVEVQSILSQHRGIDFDLKLFGFASPGIDFAHARNGAELVLNLPVLKILECHGFIPGPSSVY